MSIEIKTIFGERAPLRCKLIHASEGSPTGLDISNLDIKTNSPPLATSLYFKDVVK